VLLRRFAVIGAALIGENGIRDVTSDQVITVRCRIFLVQSLTTLTKSIAQVSFGRVATWRSSRSFALTRRLGVLLHFPLADETRGSAQSWKLL